MPVKTTFRGGGGWEDTPDKYTHVHPHVAVTEGQARLFEKPSTEAAQPYWTKERNMAMDKQYGTSPNSPLHTNNRWPD